MGNEGKIDLRIIKSQRHLWEAMVDLVVDKGYEKVTVNDICRKAMINRSTFYRHFEDKQDLLLRKTDEILFEMAESAKSPSEVVEDTDYSEYTAFLAFIADHRRFFTVMLGPGGQQLFVDRIYSYLYDVTTDRLRQLPLDFENPPVPIDLLCHYLSGAHLSLLRWWIVNDLPCTTEELMIYSRRLFVHDPLSLLGLSDDLLDMIRDV